MKSVLLLGMLYAIGQTLYVTVQFDKVLVATGNGRAEWATVGTVTWKEYDVTVSVDNYGNETCFVSAGEKSRPVPPEECKKLSALLSELNGKLSYLEGVYRGKNDEWPISTGP